MKHTSEEYDSFMASLPADPRERGKVFSAVVRGAMKQVTADFASRIATLGFKRKAYTLFWSRKHVLTVDHVGLHRSGSTYGAPINASVSLDMTFSIAVVRGSSVVAGALGENSNKLRTTAGKPYHMRFNAVTGDSYDKALEGMVACLIDHGEPWFTTYREAALLKHPEIRTDAANLLKAAIEARNRP